MCMCQFHYISLGIQVFILRQINFVRRRSNLMNKSVSLAGASTYSNTYTGKQTTLNGYYCYFHLENVSSKVGNVLLRLPLIQKFTNFGSVFLFKSNLTILFGIIQFQYDNGFGAQNAIHQSHPLLCIICFQVYVQVVICHQIQLFIKDIVFDKNFLVLRCLTLK